MDQYPSNSLSSIPITNIDDYIVSTNSLVIGAIDSKQSTSDKTTTVMEKEPTPAPPKIPRTLTTETVCQAVRDWPIESIKELINNIRHQGNRSIVRKNDEIGNNVLHYAAKLQRYDVLALLLLVKEDFQLDLNSQSDDDYFTPLHFAVKSIVQEGDKEREDCVEMLLKARANPRSIDKYGMTPMHYACQRGNYKGVDLLLQFNADPWARNEQNENCLHIAAYNGYTPIVDKILLKSCSDLFAQDFEDETAFHLAARKGHIDVLQKLFQCASSRQGRNTLLEKKDVDENTVLHCAVISGDLNTVNECLTQRFRVDIPNILGEYPLHLAAKHGFIGIAELLMESASCEVDCSNSEGSTPLHYAIEFTNKDMAAYLLRIGANIDARNFESYTPFLLAASWGYTDLCSFLLKRKCNPYLKDKSIKSALFMAAEEGHLDTIQNLLSNKAIRSQIDDNANRDKAPIHIAAEKGHYKIVQCLLNNGARVEVKDEDESTAMHIAARYGHWRVLDVIIKQHPNFVKHMVTDEDEDSNEPLHIASQHGHVQCVRVLLENDADVSSINAFKLTPLHLAAQSGHSEIVKLLIEEDASIDCLDTKTHGDSPLHLACINGHYEVVKILLEAGAGITVTNHKGESPLDVAIEADNEDCVELLVDQPGFEKCFDNYSPDGKSPIRQIIKKMPTIALRLFNTWTTLHADKRIDHNHKDYEVTFNYNFIDDMMAFQKNDIRKRNVGNSISRHVESTDKVEDIPKLDYVRGAKLKAHNHPLMLIASSGHEELVNHPLIISVIQHKWRNIGALLYYLNLSCYILLLITLTLFVWFYPHPRTRQLIPGSICSIDIVVPNCSSNFYNVWFTDLNLNSLQFFIIAVFIIVLTIIRLLIEASQLIIDPLEYITSIENFFELLSYTLTILFMVDPIYGLTCQSFQSDWPWQCGIFAVFFTWLNFFIFLRRIPIFGIYVLMYVDILFTFLKILLMAILFIMAFGLAFYMSFGQQNRECYAFRNPLRSFLKTLTMTTGEFEYDSIFEDTANPLYYYVPSIIMWVLFIIMMPILLMNLLVGLAVDDIKGVQEQAKLKKFELQVKLILGAEGNIPFGIRKLRYIDKLTIYPNKSSILKIIYYKILGFENLLTAEKIRAALTAQPHKLEEIAEDTYQIREQLTSVKQLAENTQERTLKIERMVELISKSLLSKQELEALDEL